MPKCMWRLDPADLNLIIEGVVEQLSVRLAPALKSGNKQEPDRWLSFNEVCEMLGVSRKAINYRIQDGTFPKPKKWGARLKWKLSTIERVMERNN